jgi:2-dehydro-3-deoxyphosphooctonate aldolase (KDO 8-P synthase)
VQRAGREGGSSGGDPEHTPALVRAAAAAGCDGLYLETHPDPRRALSDAATMLPLDELPRLLGDVVAIRKALAIREAGS